MTCTECGHPMSRNRREGGRRHHGRGLCGNCYSRLRKQGRIGDFERVTHSSDEVLDDWALLSGEGCTVPQAAERMGMSADALFTALRRAQARGDERAAFTWSGHWATQQARREAS